MTLCCCRDGQGSATVGQPPLCRRKRSTVLGIPCCKQSLQPAPAAATTLCCAALPRHKDRAGPPGGRHRGWLAPAGLHAARVCGAWCAGDVHMGCAPQLANTQAAAGPGGCAPVLRQKPLAAAASSLPSFTCLPRGTEQLPLPTSHQHHGHLQMRSSSLPDTRAHAGMTELSPAGTQAVLKVPAQPALLLLLLLVQALGPHSQACTAACRVQQACGCS